MRASVRVPVGGLLAGALAGGVAAWYLRARRTAGTGAPVPEGEQGQPELVVLPMPDPEELRDEVPREEGIGLAAKAKAAVRLGEELAASIAHRVVASVPESLRRSDRDGERAREQPHG